MIVPLPLPWLTVGHRYSPLPTVTEFYRYLRYKGYQRYINFSYKTLNICSKGLFRIGNASKGKIR